MLINKLSLEHGHSFLSVKSVAAFCIYISRVQYLQTETISHANLNTFYNWPFKISFAGP